MPTEHATGTAPGPDDGATTMPQPGTETLRAAATLLLRAAAPERRHLRAGGLWLLLAALLEALGPLLGQRFIDQFVVPGHGSPLAMAGLLLGALAAGLLASLLRYGQLLRLAGVAMRSVQRLREQVAGHVLRLPIAWFDRAITGQVVSRVTNDTEAVKQLYVQVLFVMLDSAIVLAGALAAMLWLDWRLALVVATLVPAVALIVFVYQRLSAPAVARTRALRGDLNALVAESIAGVAVLQTSGATGRFRERFAATNAAHFAARRQELRANAWLLRPVLDMLNVVILAAVLWVYAGQTGGAPGALQVGVLYAFISYTARVVEPLIQITMQFAQIQQALVGAARVQALLREAKAPPSGSAHAVGAGAIAVAHLRFGYRPDRPVLQDLAFEVPAGAFWGVVGHTGSGKSTLLALLLRFYRPDAGDIRIDGVPLHQLAEDDFRDRVALVPQEPHLLSASVRENIAMGRDLPAGAVERAAEAAHAAGFIARLPQGYDTPLGEGGARLSAGQRQLLALARALAGQPRILLLDEATAHVDSDTERVVQRALAALRGRVTVLAIAHRLSTVREADRLLVLHHGRIVEAGTHDELMALAGGRYQRLYELQRLRSEGPDGGPDGPAASAISGDATIAGHTTTRCKAPR